MAEDDKKKKKKGYLESLYDSYSSKAEAGDLGRTAQITAQEDKKKKKEVEA